MALVRPETTGTFVGEVAFINAGRFGAHAGVRVFGLRLRSALVLLQVVRSARPDSRRAIRSESQCSATSWTVGRLSSTQTRLQEIVTQRSALALLFQP